MGFYLLALLFLRVGGCTVSRALGNTTNTTSSEHFPMMEASLPRSLMVRGKSAETKSWLRCDGLLAQRDPTRPGCLAVMGGQRCSELNRQRFLLWHNFVCL
ncbi:hypothetical protein PoB_001624700 [Plakobranchus ocellatus]|uniref:Secreted protein n=1 Tax=Plakobranchus ocellatus TaxID=259542 RepID=A0AAV3Z5A4_9GAST|nr:hypothetical protein PoB_001624700 [Plakobranchus ocellatus]